MRSPTNMRVYVELEGSGFNVLIGALFAGEFPIWMLYPDRHVDTEENVYIYLPNERGHKRFISSLSPLTFHADIPESRCFLKKENIIYFALLDHNYSRIPASSVPAIFVRLGNHTTLAGVFHVWEGTPPTYVL